MKRLLVCLALCLIAVITSNAQQEELFSPFQFTFTYPVGTNGANAKEYTNGASLNLLVGVSKNEESFAIASISNVISQNAKGFQLAGISNHIGNYGKGIAIAGGVNTVGGSFKGIQVGGLANIVKVDFKGLQLSGAVNTAKNVKGLQFAGLSNIANNVYGLQFSGLINIAKDVKGVQFAGLINIADQCEYPIGLINIIKKGEKGIAISYDLLSNAVISFRSGGKYTYGILGLGLNTKTNQDNNFVAEGGYGVHIPITNYFRIDNEIKATSISNNSDESSAANFSYLLAPSFTLAKHYNIFAGVSLNYFYSSSTDFDNILPSDNLWNKIDNGNSQSLYIGYQIGLQYIF